MSKRKPITHNYTVTRWGHDYTFQPRINGLEASMMGWGRGIKVGDSLLLLGNQKNLARYDVKSISYFSDPSDMWSAEVAWMPQGGTLSQNIAHVERGDLKWETINAGEQKRAGEDNDFCGAGI